MWTPNSSSSMQWSWRLHDSNAPRLRQSVLSYAVWQMTGIFSRDSLKQRTSNSLQHGLLVDLALTQSNHG